MRTPTVEIFLKVLTQPLSGKVRLDREMSFEFTELEPEENTHEGVTVRRVTVLVGRDRCPCARIGLVGKSANITFVVAVGPLYRYVRDQSV